MSVILKKGVKEVFGLSIFNYQKFMYYFIGIRIKPRNSGSENTAPSESGLDRRADRTVRPERPIPAPPMPMQPPQPLPQTVSPLPTSSSNNNIPNGNLTMSIFI